MKYTLIGLIGAISGALVGMYLNIHADILSLILNSYLWAIGGWFFAVYFAVRYV